MSAKSRWLIASHNVQNISHWKNSESTTTAYTAKASYRIRLDTGKIESRGECINIDQHENILSLCSKNISKLCIKHCLNSHKKYISIIINFFAYIFGFLYLVGNCENKCYNSFQNETTHNSTHNETQTICYRKCKDSYYIVFDNLLPYALYISFIAWCIIFIENVLLSNVYILKRIWKKSMMPYLQLYVSFFHTWALCDLFNWNNRILIAVPSLFLNQIMIINNDGIYFKERYKKVIIIQLFFSLIWNSLLIISLRRGWFYNMGPKNMFTLMIAPETFYLNNISVFFSKGSSIIFLLLGQIIFRFKHPDKSYMLRTNYTVKSNREWNKLFRNNRVNKRKTLERDVEKMKSTIEITI